MNNCPSCSSDVSIFDKNGKDELRSTEKQVEIAARDNLILKREILERIEIVVISIMEQIVSGTWPKISYKLPSVETLMDQIENSNERSAETEIFESSVSNDEDIFPDNPDSGFLEAIQDEDLRRDEEDSTIWRVVSLATKKSQPTFILILKVLEKIQELLSNDQTETRRGFFYELKSNIGITEMISSQTQIDRIVNAVASLLELSPWDLPLVASAKGLCSGDLKIDFQNEESIDFNCSTGNLIPSIISNAIRLRSRAEFVLVVEKDSVFQKLLQENISSVLNCLLVTGKGYPDLATRILVNIFAEKLELPVYVLVDADPHGIEIMLTYKFGSISLSFENWNLGCREAHWIGLRPSELSRLGIETMPLTDSDFSKLDSVYSRPYIDERISHELQILRRGKAEIEAIFSHQSQSSDALSQFVFKKIQNCDFD